MKKVKRVPADAVVMPQAPWMQQGDGNDDVVVASKGRVLMTLSTAEPNTRWKAPSGRQYGFSKSQQIMCHANDVEAAKAAGFVEGER